MLQTFLRDLQQPEYVHVLLNPLPVYGLAIGLIGLIVALCLRSRRAQITSLLLIFIAAGFGVAGRALRRRSVRSRAFHGR